MTDEQLRLQVRELLLRNVALHTLASPSSTRRSLSVSLLRTSEMRMNLQLPCQSPLSSFEVPREQVMTEFMEWWAGG